MKPDRAIVLFLQQINLERRSREEPYYTLSWQDIDMLYFSMLDDMIDGMNTIPNVEIFFAPTSIEWKKGESYKDIEIIGGETKYLNENIFLTLNKVFNEGYRRVILFLRQHSFYSVKFIEEVFSQLEYDDDCLIFGGSRKGDCCMFALKTNHSEWFKDNNSFLAINKYGMKIDWLLKQITENQITIFPTPILPSIESGYDIMDLKNKIEETLESTSQFARNTYEVFKYLEKKYTRRKPKNEAWDIRRHI